MFKGEIYTILEFSRLLSRYFISNKHAFLMRDTKCFNSVALRMAKTLWSFGCSECSRVNREIFKTPELSEYFPLIMIFM